MDWGEVELRESIGGEGDRGDWKSRKVDGDVVGRLLGVDGSDHLLRERFEGSIRAGSQDSKTKALRLADRRVNSFHCYVFHE